MITSKVKVDQAKYVKLQVLIEILYLHHHNSFKGQDIVFIKPASHKKRQHHVRVERRSILVTGADAMVSQILKLFLRTDLELVAIQNKGTPYFRKPMSFYEHF